MLVALVNMFVAATVETPIPGFGDIAIQAYRLHDHFFVPMIGLGGILLFVGAMSGLLKGMARHDG